jgi:Rubisco LSMT substrate-binding
MYAQPDVALHVQALTLPRSDCISFCRHAVCLDHVQIRNVACNRYQTTAEQDEAIISDSSAKPRKRVAARLIRIEKNILNRACHYLLTVMLVLHRPAAD